MANPIQDAAINSRTISVVLFDQAKQLWALSLACGVLGPLFGLVSSFLPLSPVIAPITLVLLAFGAEILQWWSDDVKEIAESLLRRLDLKDAFGWPISQREVSDILAQNERLSKAFIAQADKEPYFGSATTPGTIRALENLEESAWWSKHLSKSLGQWCFLIVAILIVFAIIALIVSVEAVHSVQTLHAVGNVVTASLTLVFSLGLIRLSVAYYGFGNKAEEIELQAAQLASHPEEAETEAMKLWQDYHLARATAPFIPTWFWRRKRDHLNSVWKRENARH